MKNSNLISVNKVGSFFFQYAIYFVLLILILGITAVDPTFLSVNSIHDILLQSATRAIIALGAAFVLITGGVDLSAGRMVGFAAVISASMLQIQEYSHRFYPGLPNLPLWVPVLIAIFMGLLVGAINGLIVSRLSVPPFIATLGSMVAVLGLNSLYFDMKPNQSQPIGGLRPDFTTDLGSGFIGNGVYSIPYIVIIALLVAVIVWVIFNKTRLGKSMYAIGGNVQAAIVSGINVKRVLLYVYAIAGALYGLAGVMEAARTGGATSNYGNMYELDAIAACVVGGVSTAGGIGTVPGVLVGVLIFGVINYGLTYIGVSPYWQLIIKGLIIIAAVAFDIRKYLTKK
ncbi:methyl-galactoside transporter subunit; membrane component of ABC superfamily [Candidatus Desulfosporosinus infrequens]|uniref:Methyl-galactoside transporter subunit membrane component of ABC superfamily n=1 Tax=Candidatus Desulfosporosinus infrequens TaxID=2043169 RepID=A0A2U3KQV0_9FIRM|nr:galactose/methyl galactoside ABC transporter permease MglC [Desulfosporosinus sp.]SPF42053.1 methyl-galactoside transporter subunit; membrane component of ABC superfamily [Candidatus Desulfosporosinus infrequens]